MSHQTVHKIFLVEIKYWRNLNVCKFTLQVLSKPFIGGNANLSRTGDAQFLVVQTSNVRSIDQKGLKSSFESIEKIKATEECRRMRIENKSQTSIMGTFSRGRLANQLSSFALQYSLWKVVYKEAY